MEILAGFLIALAIGVTGVGAGSMTAPIRILFFHQSASDAVTTALVFGTVVKLIATPIYMSRGHVNFRVLKFMAFGGLPAVLIGRLELNSLDQKAMVSRPGAALIVGVTVLADGYGDAVAQPDAEDRVESGGAEMDALDCGANRV